MSAQEFQRHLSLKSYGQAWNMLQKIPVALEYRKTDDQVRDNVIELDAGTIECLERYREWGELNV